MEEKLIEAVRGRTILYDTSHADYLKVKLKLQIWEEIAKKIGMKSGDEAKSTWEKLRHSLRDALRRQAKCLKSGAPAETIRLWKYQTQMEFLQPYMANRPRESNLNDDNETENSISEFLETNDPEEGEQEAMLDSDVPTIDDEPQMPIEFQTSQSKKRKKDAVVTLIQRSIANQEERAEERAKLMEQMKPQEILSKDPLYHFFMFIYESTKAMPPSAQHTVRNKVFNVVSEMEASLLNVNSTHNNIH